MERAHPRVNLNSGLAKDHNMCLKFLRSTSNVLKFQVVLLDNSQLSTTSDQKTVQRRDLLGRVGEKAHESFLITSSTSVCSTLIEKSDGEVAWLNLDKDCAGSLTLSVD